jgi:hypothetical protein
MVVDISHNIGLLLAVYIRIDIADLSYNNKYLGLR